MDFQKPNQYLVRLDVCVSRLGVCEWFCLLFGCISLQRFGTLINNCVCYIYIFKAALFFSSSKIVNTFAFQGQGVSSRDWSYCRLYHVPSCCVSGHNFFFFDNLKTQKGCLIRFYTVHQSMHKWQLVFLSHCLNFFSVFIENFYTDWFTDGQFYTQTKQYSTLPKISVASLKYCILTPFLCNWVQWCILHDLESRFLICQ